MDGTVTDPVNKLQGGKDGVGFQGAPEHAELHRVCVLQIDAGVSAPVVALLGKVQDLHGVLLIAVTGGPPLQLLPGTAAEFQQLLPVLFEEIEHPGNGGILLPFRGAEGSPAHMDVESAGSSPVAAVSHSYRFFADRLPGHGVQLSIQGHGVGYQLKALVQRAVVFDVQQGLALIGQLQQCPGVLAIFARLVHLQLYTKKPGPLSIEDGLRFIVVVMNGSVVGQCVEAGQTVGVFVVFIGIPIVGRRVGNQGAAATADGVVGITAILAQGKVGSACVVAGPKPLSAMAADQSVKLQTMGTEFLAAEVA